MRIIDELTNEKFNGDKKAAIKYMFDNHAATENEYMDRFLDELTPREMKMARSIMIKLTLRNFAQSGGAEFNAFTALRKDLNSEFFKQLLILAITLAVCIIARFTLSSTDIIVLGYNLFNLINAICFGVAALPVIKIVMLLPNFLRYNISMYKANRLTKSKDDDEQADSLENDKE